MMISDAGGRVLRLAGEQAMAAGHRMIDHAVLKAACEAAGLAHEEWFGGVVELRAEGMVQMRDYEGKVALLQLTSAGVWAYLTRNRADLADVTEALLDLLDGAEPNVALALGAELGQSPLLVESVLEQLAGRRQVTFSRIGPDSFRIHRFTL